MRIVIVVVLGLFLGSPASAAKCPKACKSLLRTELNGCKAACPKRKVGKRCRSACGQQRRADLATCKAAIQPSAPLCGRMPVVTSTTASPASVTTTTATMTPTTTAKPTTTTTSAAATSTTAPPTTTTAAPPSTTTTAAPTTTTVTPASTTTTTTPSGLPELSIDDVSVTEGDAGTSTVTFTITQSEPSANLTMVSWATANDSAVAPDDYLAASGTAQITAGNTSADISVTIKGDALAEADESLLVRLSNAVNATIVDDEGSAEVVNDDGGAPTTFELIEAARVGGMIDDETALLYKVFAEFQDARLPAQYQGRDDAFFEGIAIREAARRFDTLTPANQAILAPFLEAPDLFALPVSTEQRAPLDRASSSAVAVNGTNAGAVSESFKVLELVPDNIRLGWNENSPLAVQLEQAANRLKAEFDARIKAKMTIFLGIPAAGKVLIVLEDTPGPSFEVVNNECTVARIFLRDYDPWVLAHELTHALLDLNFAISACNDVEKLWMHEATAHWAQHYVYPPANQGREQTAATWFLTRPEESLSLYEKSPRGHEYGAYLWFLRLAGQENNPGVVRAIWESAAGVSSLEAIESVLQGSGLGGFKNQWPKFALDNWNRLASEGGPYRKYYDWDKLDHKASQNKEYEAKLDGLGWATVQLEYDLPILSAEYQRWDFTKDPNIQGILLKNDGAGNDPNASIWAIVKIKDQPWPQAEDWSNEKEHFYCRDKDGEDVEEIIIVVSNHAHQGNAHIMDQGDFAAYFTALPCNDWTGSTTYQKSGPSTGFITSAEGENLRFRPDLTGPLGIYKAIEGTVTVHINETFPFEDGTCTSTALKSFNAKDHGHFALLALGGNVLQFTGEDDGHNPPLVVTVTSECSSSSGEYTFVQDNDFFDSKWFDTGPDLRPIAFGATTINDSYSRDDGDEHQEWTWNFVKDQ